MTDEAIEKLQAVLIAAFVFGAVGLIAGIIWGSEMGADHGRKQGRLACEISALSGKRLNCWGTAQDGHPRHPLMLAYDTPLVQWSAP